MNTTDEAASWEQAYRHVEIALALYLSGTKTLNELRHDFAVAQDIANDAAGTPPDVE